MTDQSKLVVFDCDGTLVDSQHMIVDAMHNTFAEFKLDPVSDIAVRRIIGLSLEQAMAELRPDLSSDDHIEMASIYKKIFYDLRMKTSFEPDPLYPGTMQAIEALRDAGYHLGVATGNSKRGLDRVIEQHDLKNVFISLQCADGHPSKPHPSMLHTAMADCGAQPDTTVMIGDTSFDMIMARSAGTHAIGVEWGYHDADELIHGGAHHIADEYHRIPDLVNRLILKGAG